MGGITETRTGVFMLTEYCEKHFGDLVLLAGDRGSTVVKVLYYNSEGRWFDPSWCQWIFH